MTDSIENISVSLVREFLKRKGLSVTYQTLDEEAPKTEYSITNRTELARHLHIERLLKKNKERKDPLRTILEVVAKYMVDRSSVEEDAGHPQTKYVRQKSRQSIHGAGIIVEDDLETELMIGRGMNDVFQQQPIEVMPPSQPKPHIKRKHRQSFQQNSQEAEHAEVVTQEQEGKTANNQMSSDPLIESHDQNPDESNEAGDIDKPSTVPSPPQCSSTEAPSSGTESIMSSGATAMTSSIDEVPVNPATDDPIDSNAAVELTAETCPEPHPEATDTQQSTAEPKPSQKIPDYISVGVKKTDLEKSMELLRQRRATQLAAERVLGGLADEQVNSPDREIRETKKVTKVTSTYEEQEESASPDLPVSDPENTEETGKEESYSPRVIYTETDVPAPATAQNIEKEPEQTISKQPVEYMKVKEVISSAKSIDIHTASALKKLVLGSASQTFTENWLSQGLGFCDIPALLYGVIQHSPGTCGLMSALQAYFLLELLYLNTLTKDLPVHRKLSPRVDVRSELLACAISRLLWKCGEEKKAVLALPSDTTIFSGGGRFRPDGITETLVVNIIDNYDDVQRCASQFLPYFENDDSSGAILLLYSAVLSRGIDQVMDDMDSADTALITDEGFCSPELVNLLLCGKAASNPFNDCIELTQGLGKTVVLKGIPSRSDIGFLSLLEHTRRRYQVGTFMKTPKYPIWLCFMEHHYSLVFCLNKDLISDWKAERRFDLLYYDPLSRAEETIRLTIDTTSKFFEPPEDDEGVPPLELCLRTKWRDAQIDWNGTEPIVAKIISNPLDDLLSGI